MDAQTLALALVAGAVAAFNPCGFALLPPYLALLVADERPTAGRWPAVARAVRFTAGMTVGFVAVFSAFGLVVAPLALSVERYLPYLTVVIGLVLVLLGGWILAGRSVGLSARLGLGTAPRASWWSQVGYGVSFASASLSCTIGPFLAVTSTSLRGSSFVQVVASYVVYALGMGTVVLILALAAATAQASVVRRMRRAGQFVARLGGLVLIVAGAYVAWYGWFEIRVLSGGTGHDVVVDRALKAQQALAQLVDDAGAPVIVVALAALVLLLTGLAVVSRLRRRSADVESTAP
ncbi:MAG: cytochrome c biogenesis protein CcdA [Nocardioidaceae bacterium]